jgi:L-asparaginase
MVDGIELALRSWIGNEALLRNQGTIGETAMKIKIFSVGGTIDKVYFDKLSEYQVGFPSVRDILGSLPIAFEYEIESLLRKDSLDMDDADRKLVRERVAAEGCKKIIITHGTDTMVETAKELRDIPGKCIVLTGAMEPAHFKSSDAVFNVGVAVGAVSSLPDGVYVAMNGRIFDPFKCRKNRDLGIFEDLMGTA